MEISQIVVLALIQGLTEFLPISSSAHLVLLPRIVDWPRQGLDFDVAIHVGTLLAVIVYFQRDLRGLVRGWARSLHGEASDEGRLAWGLLLGVLPIAVIGLVLEAIFDYDSHELPVAAVATCTVVFALLLGAAGLFARGERRDSSLRWWEALLIGAAQAFAVLPGTSRAGVTMTCGLFLGLSRRSAARFSFLLAVPTILLAGGYEALQVVRGDRVDGPAMLLGAILAGLVAFPCIHVFLRLVERVGLMPFAVYRLALGGYLLFSCLGDSP